LYGLIFGLLPFLAFRIIHSFKPFTPWRIIGACIAPLIIGPSFGFYHQYLEKKELEDKGLWTKCTVVDEKYSRNKSHDWLIKCSYLVDNKEYQTSFKTDEKKRYTVGDNIQLIYSAEFPKIYRLEYEWNNNNNR
jgi:hypothetical protein